MKTNKPIVWSIVASSDFDQILDYLFHEWNGKIAIQFIEIIDNELLRIAHQPQIYPEINKKKRIRKCVVTKHNTLYYRETCDKIEVVRLFDNRQSPRKLKL